MGGFGKWGRWAGDAGVIVRVGMSYCDTSRWKMVRQLELTTLHYVDIGLCMLWIENCTRGEQVNWWVSVEVCSSRAKVAVPNYWT